MYVKHITFANGVCDNESLGNISVPLMYSNNSKYIYECSVADKQMSRLT